uniref:ATP synthase subunit a n=1 Tax=Graffilla buccinicola TaxID=84095 RepID=A0A7G5XUJ1_9PLAT|nr:ATP synthase F0 subunit 6 [Graffilla buccinicola]QNA49626.1 ATP synthase subunit 6 [Graffilla buccinicola]
MFNTFDLCGSLVIFMSGLVLVLVVVSVEWVGVGRLGGDYSDSLSMGVFFLFLLSLNFWGVVPGSFHIGAQVVYTFLLAMWVFLVVVGSTWEWDGCGWLAHQTPYGVPVFVVPLLNVVEVVSVGVRPLTLALRLSINMGAGQLILCLVGSAMVSIKLMGGIMLGFLLFELGVCVIQAFVFVLLMGVYYGEEG